MKTLLNLVGIILILLVIKFLKNGDFSVYLNDNFKTIATVVGTLGVIVALAVIFPSRPLTKSEQLAKDIVDEQIRRRRGY